MTVVGRRIVVTALCAVIAPACAGSSEEERPPAPAVEHVPETGERFFSAVRQLTFEGQNAEAYFSSDGQELIFQRMAGDAQCDQQFIMNIDGSELRRVSNGLGRTTCGYFYEGDERILYSSTFGVNEQCPAPPDMSRGYVWPLADFDVYSSLPDGSDLENLTDTPGYDAEATLSPDGSSIVFTSTRDGDIDVYTMNIDGSNVKRLTTTIGYDGGPFFSPDGSMIVFRADRPDTPEGIADFQALLGDGLVRPSRMEIFVMDADGGNERQVTDLGGANFAPFFHPDGRRIIFASNHVDPTSRNFDLFMIDVDGSNLVQVTTSGLFDGFPMFSPDGSKLVFASNRHGKVEGETNIFIADWVEP